MQGLPKQSSDIAVHLRCIPVAKQDTLGTKQLLLSQRRRARARSLFRASLSVCFFIRLFFC
jgi:hypothetical protein